MPTTPNPATTEWVPLWDLNSIGGGAAALLLGYKANVSTVTAVDPGLGFLKWNNANQLLATFLYISKLTDGGFDATAVFQSASIGDQIIIQDRNLASNNQIWKTTGVVVNNGTWFSIPVSLVSNSGTSSFIANQKVTIIFKSQGSQGSQGPQGPAGPQGPPGIIGPHHTTHEIGGTDVIQNNAWLNTPNIFTQNQRISLVRPTLEIQDTTGTTIARIAKYDGANRIDISSNSTWNGSHINLDDTSIPSAQYSQSSGSHIFYNYPAGPNPRTGAVVTTLTIDPVGNVTTGASLTVNGVALVTKINPEFELIDTAQPADQRFFRIVNSGGYLYFQALDDAQSNSQGYMILGRNGVLTVPNGLGATPLNASQLNSGILSDALFNRAVQWTPILGGDLGESGQTYNFQQGLYIRIGKFVILWAYLQFKGPSDGGPVGAKGTINGNLVLKNFPFPVGSSYGPPAAPFVAGTVSYYTNLFSPQDITGLTLRGGATWSYAQVFKLRSNAQNPVNMTGGDVNDSTQIIATISYFLD